MREVTLDLCGTPCPMSWVKAKLRIEELAPGDRLTLLVDDPKSVRDIPRAAEASGHAVEDPEAVGSAWRLVIHV